MVGAYSVSEGGTERIRVKKFIAHPSWNYPSMFDNDIAVLELEYGAQASDAKILKIQFFSAVVYVFSIR